MENYEIWSRRDKKTALRPEIFFEMSESQVAITNTIWSTYKEKYRPTPPPASHSWNWRSKLATATQHAFVGLGYANKIQGMMMLALNPSPCRLEGAEHKNLLYIEYLESAPWNQKPYAGQETEFLGVGTCLIDVAIKLSERCDCQGRLGLHSLEESKGFYLDQGFTSLGQDPEERLDYFELSDNVLGNVES